MTERIPGGAVRRAALADIPAETLYRILTLRVAVFVVEQAAAYPELDGRDAEPDTELFWIEEDGAILATLRLLRDADAARIGRVATAPTARGRGLAADLMRRAVARAEERWPGHPIDLDAQAHLAPWYGRFGFVVNGPGFVEDDIPHVPMRRAPGMSEAGAG
jgi:ElaA protein